MTNNEHPYLVLRQLGNELACFAPANKLAEIQRAVSKLRDEGHAVRVQRSGIRLHGCKLDGYDVVVAPTLENELLQALCKS